MSASPTGKVEKQTIDDVAASWVELSPGGHLSRLLYTNPVCFLGTTSAAQQKNVMVLSWLTATNNAGGFMFSICKRRYTASNLNNNNEKDAFFTLSVPVRGMEELVRGVGSVSGSVGSKFPQDHPHALTNATTAVGSSAAPQSKRQKKKLLHQGKSGVPGLKSVPITIPVGGGDAKLFAIAGTVAHLVCKVCRILDETIDEEHRLVLAQVERAWVHPDYWDADRHLFRPLQKETAPYLTFFGSQQFGYVVTDDQLASYGHCCSGCK